MKSKLKKWPRNWVEHVTETCSFYFENKEISFTYSKILYADKIENYQTCSIQLTFKKNDKIYDIFINYEGPTFIINYYYKNYYRIRKRRKLEQDFISFVDTWLRGSDKIGLFKYLDLGGEASIDHAISAYNISQSIESVIDNHTNRGNDGDDEGGENNPIKPFSPCNAAKPELINC